MTTSQPHNLTTKLLSFLVILISVLIFTSCQKENLEENIPNIGFENNKLNTDEENCEFYENLKDDFCWSVPSINDGSQREISLLGGGKNYTVIPHYRAGGKVDFWVENGDNTFYISNTNYWYIQELKTEQIPASELTILYRVSDLLLENEFNIPEIQENLGKNANALLKNGDLTISVKEIFGGDNVPNLFVYSGAGSFFCEYAKRQTVAMYMDKVFGGVSSISTYEYIVEQALDGCGFSCENTCADPICVFDEIVGELIIDEQIAEVKKDFLVYALDMSEEEALYLTENPVVSNDFYDFFSESLNSASCSAPNIFCRIISVFEQIEDNHLSLLENCVSEYPQYLDDWISLALFNATEVPEIINKLEEIGDEYWIQTLYNATQWDFWPSSSPIVNMDFFGIKITELPEKENGDIMSPQEFLESVRLNWVSDDIFGLNNICYEPHPIPMLTSGGAFTYNSPQDEATWLSPSPLSTIFSIKMTDDGSVICTDYNYGCCWNFSTINAPGWFEGDSWDGYHPVSGNRRFGLRDNGDGTYTFFTQGVDKITGWWQASVDATPLLDAYSEASGLWICFLGQIGNFVVDNGGETNFVYEVQTVRPEFNELYDFLFEECDFQENLYNFPCDPEY